MPKKMSVEDRMRQLAAGRLECRPKDLEEDSPERDTQYQNGEWSFHTYFYHVSEPESGITIYYDPASDTVY